MIIDLCDEDYDTDIFSFLKKTIKTKYSKKKPQLMDVGSKTQNYELPESVQQDLRRYPDMSTQKDDDVQSIRPSKSNTQTEDHTHEDKGSDKKNKKLTDESVISKSDYEMGESSKTSTIKLTDDTVISISDHEMGESSKTFTITLSGGSVISIGDHEMGESSKTSNQTSRLFDEMEELDKDGGKFNLKIPQKSFFVQKIKELETSIDISLNDKKKLARKITDYFSKKPN